MRFPLKISVLGLALLAWVRGWAQEEASPLRVDVAYASMKGKGASSVPHVADIDPVRIIVNEELEAAWADKKPAKAALDTAVSRGNAVLAAKPALRKAQPF